MATDILLFMSDQHSFELEGYAGNSVVRTPMLDALARRGCVMENAMTACPLCVPARAAMISGQLPSNNGVLFNFSALDSNQATFLHSLTVSGYETVLCGRMHFVGPDQRHGFARRIAGDRTPVFHNFAAPLPHEGGKGVRGYDENASLYYMGPGDSPVLAYDRYVVDHALDFLSGNHEKPLFMTVGVYGPHFPYVAPKELYDYYYDKVPVEDAAAPAWEHPALGGKMCETDPETVRAARAAYYALVEMNDRHIAAVYEAFRAYVEKRGHEGVFIYVSDHGDMNGRRGYYGKQVFYDPSVHIPFLIEGDGIPKGFVLHSPSSLLDVGPTVCDIAGARILPGDGKSLMPYLSARQQDEDRAVVSEQYTYLAAGGSSLGRMVRWKNWKLITYSGFPEDDIMIDMSADPMEERNVKAEYPEVAKALKEIADRGKSYDEVMVHERWMMQQLQLLLKCNYDDDTERWICPEDMEILSDPVQRKTPFSPTPWVKEMRRQIDEA